jgi:hypothetical protein
MKTYINAKINRHRVPGVLSAVYCRVTLYPVYLFISFVLSDLRYTSYLT